MTDTPMGRIMGKWPGDETDEQIAEGLAGLQRSSKLNQRLGFLEGLLGNLEMLDDHELRPAIQRGMKRYEDIVTDDYAVGENGGQTCDMKQGPCACGAWH